MTDDLLPHWDCPNPACGAFNGLVKEDTKICRCCGAPRPSDLDLAFKRLQKTYEQANANLTTVQERCTELVTENRELKARLAGTRERLRAAFVSMAHQDNGSGSHGHGDGNCAAENEGLYCCIEPQHVWFEKLLDHLITALLGDKS